MTAKIRLVLVCVALCGLTGATAVDARAQTTQPSAATDAAMAAAKASPDLVGALSKEIGASPEQAAGAAGALFGVAKSRLKTAEFSQVSQAIPGMNALLKAAPSTEAAAGIGALSQGPRGALRPSRPPFPSLDSSPIWWPKLYRC
jgi:hypothetical protein